MKPFLNGMRKRAGFSAVPWPDWRKVSSMMGMASLGESGNFFTSSSVISRVMFQPLKWQDAAVRVYQRGQNSIEKRLSQGAATLYFLNVFRAPGGACIVRGCLRGCRLAA